MAFFKTGTAPAREIEPNDLGDFAEQAVETCQACGYRRGRDETGTYVCRTEGCPKAIAK